MNKIKTDVAVIAAGAAGLSAAIAAAESGAKVVVVEKGNTAGGTANMGMGPFAVESVMQKQMMCTLTREKAFERYMRAMDWNVDAKIVHDYFWRSADTIDWLADMGVEFSAVIKNFPESERTWHVVQPEGGGHYGPRCASAMIKCMYHYAVDHDVSFYFETSAYKLKKEENRIVGVYARNRDGDEFDIDAKAVIIATGGFGTNPEMILSETGYTMEKDILTFRIPGIVGDGVRMAWEAGGAKGRMMMEKIVGHSMPVCATGEVIQFINFSQGSPIAVNKAGKRVCDESVMQNMSIAANIIDFHQDRTLYKILDDKMIRYFRKNGMEFPNEVFAGDPTDHFDEVWSRCAIEYPDAAFAADSVEELAEQIGIPSENLIDTVETYNEMCEQSYDEEFGKARQYLHAIDGKRFYAYRMTIGAYGSLGGIKINSDYEAVSVDGSVLKGLYAAGSDCCEIYNGTYYYYFPGNSMGFAINSGRFAGENAAEYAGKI